MGVHSAHSGNGTSPSAGNSNYCYACNRNVREGFGSRQRPSWRNMEDDSLIIEDNTIYEIDLDCMECRRKYGGRCR